MTAMHRAFPILLALVPASLLIAALGGNVPDARAAEAAAVQPSYDKLCKSCHGADGKGNPVKAGVLKIDAKLLDFHRDEAKALDRDAKKKILLEGKDKMPAYGKKLSPGDVDPLLDLVERLQKES